MLRNTSFDHQAINTLFSTCRLASHYLLSHIASHCGNTTRFVIILFHMLLCLWIFNQHCCNRLPSVSSNLFKGGFFLIRIHQSHNAHSPPPLPLNKIKSVGSSGVPFLFELLSLLLKLVKPKWALKGKIWPISLKKLDINIWQTWVTLSHCLRRQSVAGLDSPFSVAIKTR